MRGKNILLADANVTPIWGEASNRADFLQAFVPEVSDFTEIPLHGNRLSPGKSNRHDYSR